MSDIQMEWQPIETAPMDGTIIMLVVRDTTYAAYYGMHPHTSPAGVADKNYPWVILDETNGVNAVRIESNVPAYWMPLPGVHSIAREALGEDADAGE